MLSALQEKRLPDGRYSSLLVLRRTLRCSPCPTQKEEPLGNSGDEGYSGNTETNMKLLILIFLLSITQVVARRRRWRPRCGKNEWYDYCFNKKCEATCSEPNPICTLNCERSGCTCEEGYVRHKRNCILKRVCPQ
ncbi:hypothetical protein RB195_005226 [Necator americanus]|uniref:Trypsin Inhibitor like cysteine rich domain protein n=1 Tax=Necator americanus TaxID=51031 RepID=A0ABR1BLU1_NECAM